MIKLKKFIHKNFSSFAYFFSYLRYRIFIAVALSIAVGVLDGFGLSMFLPLLQMVNDPESVNGEGLGKLSFLVEWLENSGVSISLFSILGVMTFFFLFKGLAQFASRAYRVILQQNFIKAMRLRMLNALNKIGFKNFVTSDVGRIQNTMTGEVENVSQAYAFYFLSVEQFVLVLVYMSFAFFVNFQFAILVSVGGGLTNLLFKIIYKKTKSTSRSLTSHSHLYQGQVIQHVANYKYLKATGLVENFANKLKNTISLIEFSRKRMGIYGAILAAAREPILIVVVAVVIIIETQLLGGSLGGIIVSLLFFYRALSALVIMQTSWNRFLERSGSMENVMDFQRDLEKNSLKEGTVLLNRFERSIKIQDLSFNYGESRILHSVDLTIVKDESIAFVGESGSGKTTLVNVIAGLLPSDLGEINIDGIPYSELKLSTLQKRIGYITQEPVIFNDTIFNNVTFWDEKTPENIQRFRSALAKASLEDLILDLENKEETQLGNNGINLSGGQKQRISIARELYKDVDILIMDEATSALDSETERSIQKSIDALKGKFTILMVAHRLSTIKNADRVVLMRNGRIEDEGTYEELVLKLPEFKKMIELQKV